MQFRHANGLPFIAVGIDGLHDGDQKAVSEDLEQLCSELSGVSFLPVNPYTGHNVHRLFHDVVHDIVEFVLPSVSTLLMTSTCSLGHRSHQLKNEYVWANLITSSAAQTRHCPGS